MLDDKRGNSGLKMELEDDKLQATKEEVMVNAR